MAALHVSEPKKKAKGQNAALIFEDEVSFRQDSTLHATWARRGCQPLIPVTGQRKSVKMFGAIELFQSRFHYHRDSVFNAETYLDFLEQLANRYYPQPVYYIHDNASYHTDERVQQWLDTNHGWFYANPLPSYSPELNAAEPLWKYTRKTGTHNRYFETEAELAQIVQKVFRSIQRNPSQIQGYLQPFR